MCWLHRTFDGRFLSSSKWLVGLNSSFVFQYICVQFTVTDRQAMRSQSYSDEQLSFDNCSWSIQLNLTFSLCSMSCCFLYNIAFTAKIEVMFLYKKENLLHIHRLKQKTNEREKKKFICMSDDWSCLLFYLCIYVCCIIDAVRGLKNIYTHIGWARALFSSEIRERERDLSRCPFAVDVIPCVIHHHLYRSNSRFLVLSL